MPDFHVIKGGANSTAKRKSVAGSKRVTEEQKRAANIAQGVSVPEIATPAFGSDSFAFDNAAPTFDPAHFDQFNGEGDFAASPNGGFADSFAGEGEPPSSVDFASDAAGAGAVGYTGADAFAAGSVADGSAAAGKRRARPSVGKKSTASKVMTALLVVLTCLVVVVALGFGWFRWLHGSDTVDIQGTWYVNGSEATMTFTESEIVLTDEVSYEYELKPADKTIRYGFSHMSGVGSYRFSLNREMVAIFDGEATAMDTLKADFTWMLGAVLAAVQGQTASPAPADAENYTLLTRMPMAVVPEGSLAFPTLAADETADVDANVDEAAAAVEGMDASTDAATDGGEAAATDAADADAAAAAAADGDASVAAAAVPEAAEE